MPVESQHCYLPQFSFQQGEAKRIAKSKDDGMQQKTSLRPAQMSQECLGPKQYILTQVPPDISTAVCLDASLMGVGREVSKGTP